MTDYAPSYEAIDDFVKDNSFVDRWKRNFFDFDNGMLATIGTLGLYGGAFLAAGMTGVGMLEYGIDGKIPMELIEYGCSRGAIAATVPVTLWAGLDAIVTTALTFCGAGKE